MVDKFREIATEKAFTTKDYRRILGLPNQPLQGSIAARKLDVGFVQTSEIADKQTHWSHILVMGKLKRNSKMDTASSTCLDLGRYVRGLRCPGNSSVCPGFYSMWTYHATLGI